MPRTPRPHRLLRAGLVSTLALHLAACAPESTAESPAPRPRVLLVGVDGLEWDVLLPLMRAGRLPNLSALAREGTYGTLQTLIPTESPRIWTSVVTGVQPDRHGITSFVRFDQDGAPRLLDRRDRNVPAIWNIASEHGRRVCVVGWWMTHPVETVRGVMIAQANTEEHVRNLTWKGSLLKGVEDQVYPPGRAPEIFGLVEEVEGNLGARVERRFGVTVPDAPFERHLLESSLWSFRADIIYERVTKYLIRHDDPYDLVLTYLGGADVSAHRFWRYREPERYVHPPRPADVGNLGHLVDDYYEYIDHAIGGLRDAVGPRVDVFVISDHGMVPANLDKMFTVDEPGRDTISAAHFQGQPGVFLAAGPHVRVLGDAAPSTRDELRPVGNVVDMMPTLLRLLNVPAPRDLDGRALEGVLRFPGAGAEMAGAGASNRERLEQLKALGYVD
jgi:arylsulfatase A-like enzyme